MSEFEDEVTAELARIRDLPIEDQPAAFELLRKRLEAEIDA
ncbi:MAG: hypothetical protein RL670_528 [Actinomycetota bacterium]|jgi:hypothetical protein